MRFNEIMHAREANKRSQNVVDEKNHLPEIFDLISSSINGAIERGDFICNVLSKYEIPDYILDKLNNDLGYKCRRMSLHEEVAKRSIIIEW